MVFLEKWSYNAVLGCTRGTSGNWWYFWGNYQIIAISVESGVPWATDGNFGKMNNVWSLEDIWIFRQLMGILGQWSNNTYSKLHQGYLKQLIWNHWHPWNWFQRKHWMHCRCRFLKDISFLFRIGNWSTSDCFTFFSTCWARASFYMCNFCTCTCSFRNLSWFLSADASHCIGNRSLISTLALIM